MSDAWRCAVLIACAWACADTARVLIVVPTPSLSHQLVFRPMTQELARRGHHVVVLTTDPAFPPNQAPPNLTEIDLHDVSYPPWIGRVVRTCTGTSKDLYKQVDAELSVLVEMFAKQMRTEAMKQLFANEKERFDLVITEAWTLPALALGHVYNVPVILMSTLGGRDDHYELMGAPVNTLLYPDALRTRLYNLTVWEKVTELYKIYRLRRLLTYYEAEEDVMLKEVFGEGMLPIKELKKNVELLMVNIDPVFEGYRPVPPNVIHLGGLNCAPSKDLPEELKSWMDSSKHGVIYMSFGTIVEPALLPPDRMAVFSRVFSKLPYDVLWKWKGPPPGMPANVRTSAWLPQADLLSHSNTVLFITQAGLQSTDEALRAGVPLLAFPMFGDQWYNAEQYERLAVGRRLELDALTDQQLQEAIEGIINDQGYRTRSKLLGQEMADRPESSLERAVWWVERTLRRRGLRVRAPAAPEWWLQYIGEDLIALALALVASVTLAVFGLYRFLTKPILKVKSS